jgi:ferredoxin-NADP reductase
MKLNLVERRPEAPGVESFIFRPEAELAWKAGQFLHYVLHHEPTDDRGSDRWFTVASAPFQKDVMITTRLAAEKGSTFKSALAALKIGEAIEISDTDGDFIIEDTARDYVFIAGGIGVTPFHSILKEMDHAGVPLRVTLLYSNRDAQIPYKDEFDALQQKNPNLAIHYIISPERIDEASIRALVPDLEKPLFYVSGPEPMVESLGTTLKSMGIAPERIKQDWFPGYPAE